MLIYTGLTSGRKERKKNESSESATTSCKLTASKTIPRITVDKAAGERPHRNTNILSATAIQQIDMKIIHNNSKQN